ncbi:MAG: hypothetical protein IPM97_14275 [Bdellovibrionaceae bacterium]|nr:hypothetical protein [Pseudobdellovibrionaceae bacterium]
MKKLIFAMILTTSFSAFAAQVPMFKCQVGNASAQPTVTATISVSDNESIDFVTIDLNDKGVSTLFMQLEKGSVQKQVDGGSFTTLILDDKFSQGEDGVIRNAGILGLGLDQAGVWSGLLSVRSNIYMLECQKL